MVYELSKILMVFGGYSHPPWKNRRYHVLKQQPEFPGFSLTIIELHEFLPILTLV
jgi:hypothetical protein